LFLVAAFVKTIDWTKKTSISPFRKKIFMVLNECGDRHFALPAKFVCSQAVWENLANVEAILRKDDENL
jgi:hypothetical protein